MNPTNDAIPGDWSGLAGRDDYLRENGFSAAGYEETKSHLVAFGVDLTIPNPPRRREIIKVHDLHHVMTGYGTDLVGEGEISTWELRAGTRGVGPYVLALIVISAFLGIVLAPRRMVRAWFAAKGARPLWASPMTYPQMLEKSLSELRAYAGMPSTGLATEPRRLHQRAPGRSEPTSSPRHDDARIRGSSRDVEASR
jgi:hypothetical protein